MPITVLPIRIDFKTWATQLIIDLPEYNIPDPESEDKWWDWAAQIISNNRLSNIPIPSKHIYKNKEDWSKWATYLIDSVNRS
jgi:hypothetical protein